MNKLMCAAAAAVALVGCKSASLSPSPPPGKSPQSVGVTSPAFSASSPIPAGNTCDGAEQSPGLSWTAMPDGVQSIAIIVDDPDAPQGTFTHWIVWNIAPDARTIGEGGNGGLGGGVSGTNDFGKTGYGGPCPPKGQLHHYHFKVYGLDAKVDLRPSDKRADLDKALSGHVLAQGDLVGTFQH